jgi:hypothetical protein
VLEGLRISPLWLTDRPADTGITSPHPGGAGQITVRGDPQIVSAMPSAKTQPVNLTGRPPPVGGHARPAARRDAGKDRRSRCLSQSRRCDSRKLTLEVQVVGLAKGDRDGLADDGRRVLRPGGDPRPAQPETDVT